MTWFNCSPKKRKDVYDIRSKTPKRVKTIKGSLKQLKNITLRDRNLEVKKQGIIHRFKPTFGLKPIFVQRYLILNEESLLYKRERNE